MLYFRHVMGNIVCARVRLIKNEDKKSFINRLKIHCQKKLQNYKIPVKVDIVGLEQYNNRFKKIRTLSS